MLSHLYHGARRISAAVLPGSLKASVKNSLRGTIFFPETIRRAVTPPPVEPAPPPPPAPRNFELPLPPTPEGSSGPATLRVEVPSYMFVARTLDEKPLGEYEPYAIDAFLTLLEQVPPGAVYDVGANIGLYGLLAAAYSDREVHAFEPAPDTARAARDIAAASDLKLTVEEIALGDSSGTATLYLSDSTDSSNSLNPDFRAHSKEIQVPLETVDEYVARTGVVPALLKVDTETTEHQVLAGAEKTIREHRPWIMCEVLWSLSEDNLHAVMDQHHYTIYHLNGPGERPVVNRMVGDKTWTHYMFLFAPEPVSPQFWDRMTQWRQALGGCAAPQDIRNAEHAQQEAEQAQQEAEAAVQRAKETAEKAREAQQKIKTVVLPQQAAAPATESATKVAAKTAGKAK